MKIYEIIPGKLYQSKKTHNEPDALESIQSLKITVIVNLWHTIDDDLVNEVKKYYHVPMHDGKNIDFEECEKVSNLIVKKIMRGERVLVHCYGGRNRSGLINALVVMKLLDINGKEAHALIIKQRPGALANPYFCKTLDELYIEQQV